VGQLILFIVPVLEGDEDAEIVCSGDDAHAGTGKLCTELVVASCAYALLGTVDVEGRDGRVVRGLLGEVGNGHELGVTRDAVGTARGRRRGGLEGGMAVFYLPIALPWVRSKSMKRGPGRIRERTRRGWSCMACKACP
jgi:hypothetical protein